MARLARVVVPGVPHHVTQRGNRRQDTFFCDEDYEVYKALMAEWCAKCGVQVWAYCLMPNHVHMILVPKTATSLARAVGEAHRRYTLHINARKKWSGYLWQGRFSSFPMDNAHLLSAAAYVERNPVKAELVRSARQYAWSSARAHISGQDDDLVKVAPLLKRCSDWPGLLRGKDDPTMLEAFRAHKSTGRPLGGKAFVDKLELKLGRTLRPAKRGRKPIQVG
ncbi:transposase [Magnetovibrio blakemorei]|uniref:Transposase n=1 Tax=Magnetovibrio blakemorei TaxID=28181 RepID=A0A1E5QA65_9PROT|nr:transposase [Magnetovibrio blakemorei]OEJ68696.1 transposase [Magnetovibrio blakemorei]